MPEIYNGKRSGSMSDRRSTATKHPMSDVRSGSLADVTRERAPSTSGGRTVRYRIESRDGRLMVVESEHQ